jgi:hypothetical protein
MELTNADEILHWKEVQNHERSRWLQASGFISSVADTSVLLSNKSGNYGPNQWLQSNNKYTQSLITCLYCNRPLLRPRGVSRISQAMVSKNWWHSAFK